MDIYAALRAIEAADPDGGYLEPSDDDYANHEAWAVRQYGPQVWARYTRGGWGDMSTWDDDYRPDGAG